jgi:midasin
VNKICVVIIDRFTVSVRDILSWVNFINVCAEDEHSEDEVRGTKKLDLAAAYIHGACLTFLDSFGSGRTSVDRYVHYSVHGPY